MVNPNIKPETREPLPGAKKDGSGGGKLTPKAETQMPVANQNADSSVIGLMVVDDDNTPTHASPSLRKDPVKPANATKSPQEQALEKFKAALGEDKVKFIRFNEGKEAGKGVFTVTVKEEASKDTIGKALAKIGVTGDDVKQGKIQLHQEWQRWKVPAATMEALLKSERYKDPAAIMADPKKLQKAINHRVVTIDGTTLPMERPGLEVATLLPEKDGDRFVIETIMPNASRTEVFEAEGAKTVEKSGHGDTEILVAESVMKRVLQGPGAAPQK